MRFTILRAGTALCTVLASALPALADCTDDGLTPATITCAGPVQQTAQIADNRDGLTIDVQADGEIVVGNDDAVDLSGDDNSILNQGLIQATSSSDEAIQFSGDNLYILNEAGAQILSGDKGIEGSGSASGMVFDNYGALHAFDTAIEADGGDLAIYNATGASIVSDTGRAIRGRGLNTTVINEGEIRSDGDEGVEGRDGFYMENWTGATITSTADDAVQYGEGFLYNDGTISGADDGVDVDSGYIRNDVNGIITTSSTASDAAAIDVDPVGEDGNPAPSLYLENFGIITGITGIEHDPASTSSQYFYNEGTIAGVDPAGVPTIAINFAPNQGGSELVLAGASQIIGDVIFGNNDDYLGIDDITGSLFGDGIFDGMGGLDTLEFGWTYELADLLGVTYLDGVTVGLKLATETGIASGVFRNFETFSLGGSDYSFADLGGLVAPVPVPAGVVLLGSALAGFGALRRRKAA